MDERHLTLTIKRAQSPIGKTLNFFVDSKTLQINKQFIFEEIHVQGDTTPVLGFVGGDVNQIKIQSIFHDDLGDDFLPAQVDEFLELINYVYPEDQSVSEIALRFGPYELECYLTRYKYEPIVFGEKYHVMGLKLELDLISAQEPKRIQSGPLKKGPELASFTLDGAALGFASGGPLGGGVGALGGAILDTGVMLGSAAVIGYALNKAAEGGGSGGSQKAKARQEEIKKWEKIIESAGDPPKINAQQQAGHIKGTPQHRNRVKIPDKATSTWDEPSTADQLTIEAWKNGEKVERRSQMREHDFGRRIGTSSSGTPLTKVRVSINERGEIHGHPR